MELRDSTDSLIFEKREKLIISSVSSWEKLMSNVEIKEDGKLAVYIDNASSDKVYFDNFEIERTEATVAVVVQENHYYPFGMNMKGIEELDLQSLDSKDEHRFQYNGKEKEESFGLYWNDHGARNLDIQLGRWNGVDPLAEKFVSTSSYVAMLNNPIRFVDLDGRQAGEYYNENGRHIGSDGNDDNMKYVVTDNDEARTVRQNNRRGNDTSLDEVTSAVVLPSDAALSESLDVLERTENNGGLREEASLVMNDGSIVRGTTGSLPTIVNNVQTAQTVVPNLPNGQTDNDVEVMIHSHPTTTQQVGNQAYPQSANNPSPADNGTFNRFETNIIVGRLGELNLPQTDQNGNVIDNRSTGIVIYNNQSQEKTSLTKRAVERIILN